MPTSLADLFTQWEFGVKGVRSRMFFKAILSGVVWGIWKERNKRIFENKKEARERWWILLGVIFVLGSSRRRNSWMCL